MTPIISEPSLYPVSILEDRYDGTYSGGSWIAIAASDEFIGDMTRYRYVYDGAHDGDDGAANFWAESKNCKWIAVGNSPQEALDNLRRKIHEKNS